MSALKQFTFYVRNDTTKEIATFIGQGKTMEEAAKDGFNVITSKYGADSSGGGKVLPLNVRLPSGDNVNRPKADFEGESPFKP